MVEQMTGEALLVGREVGPYELEERLQALAAEEVNPAVGWMIVLARGACVVVCCEAEAVAVCESRRVGLMQFGELIAKLLVIVAALAGALYVAQQQVVAAAGEHFRHGQAGRFQRGEAGGFCCEEVSCGVWMRLEEQTAAVLQYEVIGFVDVAARDRGLCSNVRFWAVKAFETVGKSVGKQDFVLVPHEHILPFFSFASLICAYCDDEEQSGRAL